MFVAMPRRPFLALLAIVAIGCNNTPPSNSVHGIIGDSVSALKAGTQESGPEAGDLTAEPDKLFEIGIEEDLVGENHRQIFDRTYQALSPEDKQTLDGLVQKAASNTERIFILKTFAAGESMVNVVAYASNIRGKSDSEILAGSTMRSEDTLIQQYQQTCGLAMVQVASSEYDPRYAWEMHKVQDVHAIDPSGPVAQQQVQWLHEYGGVESPRGQEGGKEIGILGPLNDKMGVFVHCSYVCDPTPDVEVALQSIGAQVKAGFPAPIRVAFAGDVGHLC